MGITAHHTVSPRAARSWPFPPGDEIPARVLVCSPELFPSGCPFVKRRTFSKLGLGVLARGASRRLLPLAQGQAATTAAGFPEDFAWGAATSAMQIEGYPYADGGGRSIWSTLDDRPSLVKDGSNDLVADDSFHRFRDDIALLKGMGLNSYRLSIGWPRVLPGGKGQPNEKGLDFYDRLLDAVLAAGVEPWVTVYHFDYPEALDKQGGWLHPDSSHWLGDYAGILARRYGDRVRHWMTINEPNITWALGWEAGMSPPYRKLSREELATGAHNLLLGHGRAAAALRAGARKPVSLSLPIAGQLALPASDPAADRAAARRQSFAMAPHVMGSGIPPLTMINMAVWLDPIYLGRHSEETFKALPTLEKLATPEAMAVIHQPLDFCAANLYFASRVRAGAEGHPETLPDLPGTAHTAYDWPITPELLYWGPKTLYERYGKPIAITENGMSRHDRPEADGSIQDPERSRFLKDYLGNLLRAHRAGVPLAGYFHWSLVDNWEFNQGFTQQFGLVYVDRKTQKRTPKASAATYAAIVRSHGRNLTT